MKGDGKRHSNGEEKGAESKRNGESHRERRHKSQERGQIPEEKGPEPRRGTET